MKEQFKLEFSDNKDFAEANKRIVYLALIGLINDSIYTSDEWVYGGFKSGNGFRKNFYCKDDVFAITISNNYGGKPNNILELIALDKSKLQKVAGSLGLPNLKEIIMSVNICE